MMVRRRSMERRAERAFSEGGTPPHGAALHGQCLLIVRGNTGVQAGAEHFPRLPCLAKNVVGFCLWKGRLAAI